MPYTAALGLSEIAMGVLLAVPSFDPEATFPFDLRQAITSPTVGHLLLAVANAAPLVVLPLLVRG